MKSKLAVVAFVVLAAMSARCVRANDAVPAVENSAKGGVMQRADVMRLLDEYFDALKSGDVSGLPFTEDITFEGPMVGRKSGEADVRKLVAGVAESFNRHIKIEVLGHVVDGDEICSRAMMTLPGGREVALLDYFRFEDGKIAHIQPYFDSRPMLEVWGAAE